MAGRNKTGGARKSSCNWIVILRKPSEFCLRGILILFFLYHEKSTLCHETIGSFHFVCDIKRDTFFLHIRSFFSFFFVDDFFFFAFDSKDNWLAFGLFTFVLYKKQPLQTNRLAFSQRRFSVKSILYVFIEHEFRSIILSCHLARCNQITMFIRLERRF